VSALAQLRRVCILHAHDGFEEVLTFLADQCDASASTSTAAAAGSAPAASAAAKPKACKRKH
jgi:hypothetical protein